MEYTDNTLLGYGEFRFTKLSRIPANYLLNLWEQKSKRWRKQSNGSNYQLYLYIEANLDKIIARRDKPIEPIKLCQKIVFCTESEARKELSRISKIEQKSFKKPIRYYECKQCGFYHLTSQQHFNYNP